MATDVLTPTLPDDVFEHEGLWWRAKKGATSTFEESVAARALFLDLHRDEVWNPWRMEEEAAGLERAEQIMGEWERAEPGFKRKTKRQLDAEMARWERDWEKKRIKREALRQKNLERYDAEREQARLELLEQQCILAHRTTEVAKLRSAESYLAMDPARRTNQVAELDEQIVRHKAAVERLTPIVGDPEDVPDQHGHLPRDRRHSTLYIYRERRIQEVRELRAKLPELEAQIKDTEDKAERSKLRAQRDVKKWHLDKLLAVPRLEAEDMCADCATPAHGHGYVSPPYDWPCVAWPGQRAIHAKVMQMLEASSKRRAAEGPAAPSKSIPQPLAVVPSGLPIAEVVQRLQELEEQYPEAEVRRGRANRWELWPKRSDN
ncbi:hypothetical protein ACIBVK_26485 [Micromonospora echinofusca]|uniref:hypothetical protein n=1 Tax=Micromonospora echinofusca TaxID=47858 RepID=UPI0037A1646C